MKNIYKKIIIMFVMVLGIMGIGAISNGYVANAATVGDQLLEPEGGWKRYDDTDKNVEYIGDFSVLGTSAAGDNSAYNGSYHLNTYSGGTIKFNFKGSKLRIIAQKNNSSVKVVKISFDGGKTFEAFSMYNNLNTKRVTIVYEKTGLENNIHNVIIDIPKTEDPHYYEFAFDAIDIDNDGDLSSYSDEYISLDKSKLNLKESESSKLTATTTPAGAEIKWSSSDETVATVDSNGNVKAIKEGQATITAQIKDTDIKATCVVTVTKEELPVEPEDPTNPDQEYIINTAYAKGDNTNNASGQVTIIFKGNAEAQLKVVKTADVDSVYVGDHFTYTIEVTNTSDKVAKSVIIKDSAPNHIQFIPNEVTTTQGTVDSSSTGNNIVVNVGDIPPLGKVTIKIPVVVVE